MTSDNALTINNGMEIVLKNAGLRVVAYSAFGIRGIKILMEHVPHDMIMTEYIVTEAPQPIGDELGNMWMHASVVKWEKKPNGKQLMPTYEDLALLHRAIFGRKRYAYQVFVPEKVHVNIHPMALHLWGRVDGTNELPDFGISGSI
jgi:hypothetical protein